MPNIVGNPVGDPALPKYACTLCTVWTHRVYNVLHVNTIVGNPAGQQRGGGDPAGDPAPQSIQVNAHLRSAGH